MAYDKQQISRELQATALGQAFYGNALRVAKDIPSVTPEERSLLDRWATGAATATDGWALQRLAQKIAEL